MELPNCISTNHFHFILFQLPRQRILIFVEICPLSVLFSAEIPFLLLCLGTLLLDQGEKSIISCSCDLQKETERKALLSTEELWGEEWFAAELLQKSSAKGDFAAGLPLGCEEVVADRYLLQCRAGILCLDSPPCLGCLGRGGATAFMWSPSSFEAVWLCPASRSLLGTGSQAGGRSPGAELSAHY